MKESLDSTTVPWIIASKLHSKLIQIFLIKLIKEKNHFVSRSTFKQEMEVYTIIPSYCCKKYYSLTNKVLIDAKYSFFVKQYISGIFESKKKSYLFVHATGCAVFSSCLNIGLSFVIWHFLPNLSNLFDTISPNWIFSFQIVVVLICVQNHGNCSLITK